MTGKMIHKMGLDKDVQQLPARSPAARTGTDPQVAAAITAAAYEYRKKEKAQ